MNEVEEVWIEGERATALSPRENLTNPLVAAPRLRSLVVNLEDEAGLREVLAVLQQPEHHPALHTLEIRVSYPSMPILSTLRVALGARHKAGRPVQLLRLGRHELMQRKGGSRPRLSYQEWAEAAAAVLRGVVGELVSVDGEPVPKMPAPPICYAPSNGWQWPEWGDK